MTELPTHPATAMFPLLGAAELAALAEDIRTNGLQVPIVTYRGQVLDGRNRLRACEIAGVSPRFEEWQGNGSPVAWVISVNLHRRHLTPTQRAAIALDALPMLEAEARERQGRRTDLAQREPLPFDNLWQDEQAESDNLVEKFPQGAERSRDRAAELFNVNPHYISDAKRIAENAPELIEPMRSGEMTITQARREMIRRTAPPPSPLPTGRYRVILADPPWSYGNTQPDYHPEQRDHYPVMSLADICALPIRDLAEDNAVLFLWTTSPMLAECFEVVKAWGFAYKSSFVWDKVKHNMGHYNSVRHELLLVCVRGSCMPDVARLFDSVVTEERTEHSRKPGVFYDIIETIYTRGPYIELFARQAREGWDRHGNAG